MIAADALLRVYVGRSPRGVAQAHLGRALKHVGRLLYRGGERLAQAVGVTVRQRGRERVETLLHAERESPAGELGPRLLEALRAFCGSAPQGDDITMVFVKRVQA